MQKKPKKLKKVLAFYQVGCYNIGAPVVDMRQ